MEDLSGSHMQLRNSYRIVIVIVLSLLLNSHEVGLPTQKVLAKKNRPNIIVILADDMGFSDIGSYGSEIKTPNLDWLAKNGLRFTQFYNTARCCPTRAALLTGLYAQQAGVGHMNVNLGDPAYEGFINDKAVTIAEVLKGNGYHTLHVGKWHVGQERPHWPTDRGFEEFYGALAGPFNYFRILPRQMFLRNETRIKDGGDNFYATNAYTDNAVKLIDEYGRKSEPFFMYLAYTAPHWPLHALPEDINKYRNTYQQGWDSLRETRRQSLIKQGIIKKNWKLSPRDSRVKSWNDVEDKKLEDLKMAIYAAQIDRMDQGIGRVLEKLKALHIEENTLILFLSDNGGCAEKGIVRMNKPGSVLGTADSYQAYGMGWANASNTPFRLYKQWVHEGGISTPMIAHWPGMIKKNGITDQQGHVVDIMATCLDVAGAPYPKSFKGNDIQPTEGRSLLPIFEGKMRDSKQPIFWEHEGNRAVRAGKWKLVAEFKGQWELYDMENDRTEMNNLAAKYPERVKTLRSLYEQWAARVGVKPWDEIRRERVGQDNSQE